MLSLTSWLVFAFRLQLPLALIFMAGCSDDLETASVTSTDSYADGDEETDEEDRKPTIHVTTILSATILSTIFV